MYSTSITDAEGFKLLSSKSNPLASQALKGLKAEDVVQAMEYRYGHLTGRSPFNELFSFAQTVSRHWLSKEEAQRMLEIPFYSGQTLTELKKVVMKGKWDTIAKAVSHRVPMVV
jgi:hypothetical protein